MAGTITLIFASFRPNNSVSDRLLRYKKKMEINKVEITKKKKIENLHLQLK